MPWAHSRCIAKSSCLQSHDLARSEAVLIFTITGSCMEDTEIAKAQHCCLIRGGQKDTLKLPRAESTLLSSTKTIEGNRVLMLLC
jgi:hypothetical protein